MGEDIKSDKIKDDLTPPDLNGEALISYFSEMSKPINDAVKDSDMDLDAQITIFKVDDTGTVVRMSDESTPHPFTSLARIIQTDKEYAWGVLCNIAGPIRDQLNLSHEDANVAAASVMGHLFDVDVSDNDNWHHFEMEWMLSNSRRKRNNTYLFILLVIVILLIVFV